jgi:nicotinate-nucleotide adenylyltransferase
LNNQQQKCFDLGNYFEFMPMSTGHKNQKDLDQLFLKNPIVNSITFFAGSFNPFHEGHRACLDLCPETNILIVPDRNPLKKISENENPYDHFILLAESLRETTYSLYPGFLSLETANPTSAWISQVKIVNKNFLMGDDSFMSLLAWKNPEVIISALTKLYVVPRTFSKEDYMRQEIKILEINPKLEIHYLDIHPYMNLSSTKLRT